MIGKTVFSFYFVISAVCAQAEFIRDDNKSVVIDTVLNLMWQNHEVTDESRNNAKNGIEGGNVWNFHNAQAYCHDLDYGGFNDWFVPSSDQLETLIEPLKLSSGYELMRLPKAFNYNPWATHYWSSSTAPYRNVYGMSCERTHCRLSKIEETLSVRCVRNNNDSATISKE